MRILVVDDSSPHRRMLTAIFGHGGHEVLTASDGEAALAILEREKVDAVVSDVRMPKLDGFQLCRAIRRDARWERLPFIFYSSVFIGGPARDLGRDVGATAYLDAKDITPQQMASELDRLVARHVRAEYDATLVRLLDDVDFARRYHQVVLDSLHGAGKEQMRDLVAESKRAAGAAQRARRVPRRPHQQSARRHHGQRAATGNARARQRDHRGRRAHHRRGEQDQRRGSRDRGKERRARDLVGGPEMAPA